MHHKIKKILNPVYNCSPKIEYWFAFFIIMIGGLIVFDFYQYKQNKELSLRIDNTNEKISWLSEVGYIHLRDIINNLDETNKEIKRIKSTDEYQSDMIYVFINTLTGMKEDIEQKLNYYNLGLRFCLTKIDEFEARPNITYNITEIVKKYYITPVRKNNECRRRLHASHR